MIAREFTILKLLEGNDKSFFSPVYQREYSWTKSNCEKLIQDINYVIENKLDSHFLGSIVYTNKEMAGVSSFCIIDGQQRITTIFFLLLAIYNSLNERNNENIDINGEEKISIEQLKNTYFYINPYKKNPDLKLILTDDDNETFRDLFLNGKIDDNTKIGKNYYYFLDVINKKSVDDISKFYFALKHLSIVNVSLEPNDDPQRIFESLNSKILPLLESDKIRNYIFMDIDYDEQKILYKDYWRKIALNVDDISKLIRYYLTIKTNNFIPEKQLYFCFKDFMLKNKNLDARSILKEIYNYSVYMKKITNYNKNSSKKYQQALFRLNRLDMSTIYPLIFICMDVLVDKKTSNLEIDDNDFDEIMMYIESYIVRRNFLKLSTASLNKFFAFMPSEIYKLVNSGSSFKDAILKTILSKTASSRFPKDTEFKNAFSFFELYNAKSQFRKYVLDRLENYNHKELIDVDNDIATGKLTIEHIMPQTLSEEWKNHLGNSYESIHQKYVNTIGNLTLTAYNSEYSNLSFDEKKTLNDKGFLFSNLFLNKYLKNQNEWGEKQIIGRSNLLFERAMKIWPYPSYGDNEVEFNIENPDTWKNVKITRLGKEGF